MTRPNDPYVRGYYAGMKAALDVVKHTCSADQTRATQRSYDASKRRIIAVLKKAVERAEQEHDQKL